MKKYPVIWATIIWVSCMFATFLLIFEWKLSPVYAGTTSLTGVACDDQVTATQYDIDFGTFSSSDVYTTFKINAGTKAWQATTPTNGSSDIYIIATNTCQSDTSWSIRIMADYMTSSISGNPHISNTGIFFSGVDTIFLFSGTVANASVTATSYTSTTDLSDRRTILTKSTVNNGLAGYYGRLFTHSIRIEQGQPVAYYSGTFLVNCNGC